MPATACTCIGHLTGKVPDTPGTVRFRWVVDVPDLPRPRHPCSPR